ncbi:hypothetical protein L596_014249 [Steinernema carpocapsae]|uniref:Uncharacterized protein n=1 Tax=Steinernema carpocapsae TaxID=34508 RepID=A0A4U5NCB5_STECR|nr:hypothetical protein L596_014249 [Steinernema carpocapsae]
MTGLRLTPASITMSTFTSLWLPVSKLTSLTSGHEALLRFAFDVFSFSPRVKAMTAKSLSRKRSEPVQL